MARLFARYSVALVTCLGAWAGSPQFSTWTVARAPRLEVYSQGDADHARKTLAQFEKLRIFFNQNGLIRVPADAGAPLLRIVSFRSEKDYENFRVRPNAEAYYAAYENDAYIVMPQTESVELPLGAHEYTHYFLGAAGLKLPAWMNEGLAEFFSTVHITDRGCTLGGILPARLQTLQHRKWLSLAQLLRFSEAAPVLQSREQADIFYAESWALVDLLVGAPEYAPHFRDLITTLNRGTPGAQALTATFGKSLDAISGDLRARVHNRSFAALYYPAIRRASIRADISELSSVQSRTLLAELLTAEGELQRAESFYAALQQQSPGDPNALAALGTIALRQHQRSKAIAYWRAAIDDGITNADICYRFALLAEEAGLPTGDIRHALERAVLLRPGFDDARYKLALLESNAGDFAAAVTQLRAIRAIAPARAFSYWSALSYASMESGDRTAAKEAAQEAAKYAHTASDRLRANQLAYIAETDVTVEFVQDADGRSRLVETRVPHGTADWNPFVEPTDRIQHAAGQLREIVCSGGKLSGLVLDTPNGRLALSVSDPQHVFMQNGPAEFTCGPQQPKSIKVEYAAAYANTKSGGIVRGISFP